VEVRTATMPGVPGRTIHRPSVPAVVAHHKAHHKVHHKHLHGGQHLPALSTPPAAVLVGRLLGHPPPVLEVLEWAHGDHHQMDGQRTIRPIPILTADYQLLEDGVHRMVVEEAEVGSDLLSRIGLLNSRMDMVDMVDMVDTVDTVVVVVRWMTGPLVEAARRWTTGPLVEVVGWAVLPVAEGEIRGLQVVVVDGEIRGLQVVVADGDLLAHPG
jgi:hypothetical protein